VLTSNATILLITLTDYCVGVSSQCHDLAEVSVLGTFWNLSLIYKTRFLSGPLALLEPSTNSVLLSLC